MKPNQRQIKSAAQWAEEWAELRRTAIRHHRQQSLELRMQHADERTMAAHNEAWSYLLASIRALETASNWHRTTLTNRLEKKS